MLAAIAIVAAIASTDEAPAGAPRTRTGSLSTMPALCFAPGTPPDVVTRAQGRLYALWGTPEAEPAPSFQFSDGARWTRTASQPGPLLRGDPTTLTWSIVPDGTLLPGSIGEPASGSNLIQQMNAIYGSQAVWIALFTQAFAEWSQLNGNTYVYQPSDDGATFPSSTGLLGVRGDIRIGAHPIDGNSGVLAYNMFPNGGDMVLDMPDTFYNNTASNSLRLRNVFAHEHGHGLGIRHVCPRNQTKLMEPFISTAFDGPQHDDTLAGQRGYGDPRETNDTAGAATDLGAFGSGTVSRSGLSVDGTTDADFFKFTVPANKKAAVTMTPVGFTYLQGPQNGDGSCSAGTTFNSLVLNKLGLELRATDGSTVLATANSQPAGAAETVTQALGAAGTYYVRVFPGAANQVQLYNVSVTVSDTTSDLSISKTDGQTTALAGSTVTYTIVVTNGGPDAVTGATVGDAFPAAITSVSWTCSASAGSSCGAPSGSGNINQSVSLLAGGTASYTAVANISSSATGTLSNTATVSSAQDPNAGNNSATDVDSIVTAADLAITKTDGQSTAAPGQVRTYTIVASNAGPNPATGATVTDMVPSSLLGAAWTCVGAGGGTCTGAGSGNINDTVNLPVGGTVTYTLTGTVSANPSALRNTATVSVPAGMGDPNPANNSATDEDTLLCFGETVAVPDGRVASSTVGAGATAWFAASLRIGNSYSIEFSTPGGTGSPPGVLTMFSGDDGCTQVSTMTPRVTVAIDPAAGTTSRRVSFTAGGGARFFRARLDNTTGGATPFTFAWSDTTLYSPAWSTNGAFDTFYSFQNTTGASVSGTLTLLDTTGVVLAAFPLSIPAGQTASVNTASLAVARNRTGTARFTHDGPPGSVIAEAAIANFSISPAYVQPVKFHSVREAR